MFQSVWSCGICFFFCFRPCSIVVSIVLLCCLISINDGNLSKKKKRRRKKHIMFEWAFSSPYKFYAISRTAFNWLKIIIRLALWWMVHTPELTHSIFWTFQLSAVECGSLVEAVHFQKWLGWIILYRYLSIKGNWFGDLMAWSPW